MSSLQTVTTNS